MQPIWLIGMMGSGKSRVGSLVAARLEMDHVDVDEEIAARVGCSIGELWGSAGEEAFRDMESAQIARLGDVESVVVSTGGGAVLRGENVRAMRRSGVVVWLDTDIATLASRIGRGSQRPLLDQEGSVADHLATIDAERRGRYDAAAHFVVDAGGSAASVADRVSGHARITIGEASEVLIGDGLPARIMADRADRRRVAVVTQPGARSVAERVLALVEKSRLDTELIDLPDREKAKRIETIGAVYDRLATFDLGRRDTVVGVGGGTVTDTAGFVAATWLRGVESVLVPTTLLGAVDASIGGKTGINVGGKNLVGAFWHPTRVSISLAVLRSSPRPLLIEGAAEAVKAGLIADPAILETYERDGIDAPLEAIVPRAVAVKASVVAEDFREAGRRAILNFGHTIGHGVELAAPMPHGHAVAIGMVAAGAISADRFGFDPQRLRGVIELVGLPTSGAGVDHEAVSRLVRMDKKRTADGIRMVLLRDYGDPVVEPVSDAEIDMGLAAVGIR